MQHVQAMCVAPYTIGDVKLGNPHSHDYIILLQSRALQFTFSFIYDNERNLEMNFFASVDLPFNDHTMHAVMSVSHQVC